MTDNTHTLVAIPSSMKHFNEGILAKNMKTGQFGTVRVASLKGKHARRNLKGRFKPTQFAVVDQSALPAIGDPVVVTLKDGNKIISKCGDILPDMMVNMDLIIIPPAKIMQTKVGWEKYPHTEFRYLAPSLLAIILKAGGSVKMSADSEPILWLNTHH